MLAALLLGVSGAAPGPALAAALGGDLELTLALDDHPPAEVPPPLEPETPRSPAIPPVLVPPSGSPAHPSDWAGLLPPAQPRRPGEFPDPGERLLWGLGFSVGFTIDQFSESQVGVGINPSGFAEAASSQSGFGGLGVYGRLGEQANDLWGGELELSAGTLLVINQVRAAFTLDVTPADWFTFAFGAMAREDVSSSCGGGPVTTEAAGATVRFDFHLGPTRSEKGRSSFTLGIVGDLGATVGGSEFSSPGAAYGLYLTSGWTSY